MSSRWVLGELISRRCLCMCGNYSYSFLFLKKQNLSFFKLQSISRNRLFLNITSQISHSFLILESQWNWFVFLILKEKYISLAGKFQAWVFSLFLPFFPILSLLIPSFMPRRVSRVGAKIIIFICFFFLLMMQCKKHFPP